MNIGSFRTSANNARVRVSDNKVKKKSKVYNPTHRMREFLTFLLYRWHPCSRLSNRFVVHVNIHCFYQEKSRQVVVLNQYWLSYN